MSSVLGKRDANDSASAKADAAGAKKKAPKKTKAPKPAGVFTGKGSIVAMGGPLVFEEDADYTFFLPRAAFKKIIEDQGGSLVSLPSSRTEIVIIGEKDRIGTKNNSADEVYETGKAKQKLDVQLAAAEAGTRKKEIEVMNFHDFLTEFPVLIPKIKAELNVANFKDKNMPPGPKRSMYNISGFTLIYSDEYRSKDHPLGNRVRGYYQYSAKGKAEHCGQYYNAYYDDY